MEQPVGEASFRLQGMAEGVTEVKQRPDAVRLMLVRRHDPRLGRHRMRDGINPRVRIARQQGRRIRLAPFEKGEVVDQAVFDHLGVARPHLARRQSVEHIRIDQHHGGLVECTDQVLACRGVDRGLAADRRIDLRQQGRRNLHEAAAALDDRAGEANQIADHPAAERNDMIRPLDTEFEQSVADLA